MRHAADAGVARAAPSHLRLAVLILEGYVYLALILAIFMGATGFLIWGVLTRRPFIAMIAIIAGAPVAMTTARAVRALLFVFPQPAGIEVHPHFGGLLHRAVQDIARRVGAPRVHRILVTDANNASAVQIPRAGVFWPVNTLELGYPLLATLSVDQIRAVIAHELGHITHAHGRFSSWVHRTRLSWVRLMDILERHRSVPAHVYFLFRFYVPRLDAQAVAVARQQELLADRLAADVTGPEVTAQALVAIEVVGRVLEQTFWPRVFERVQHDPDPPNPFSQMGPDIWEAVEDRTELLDRLLARETAARDTHPALRVRLAEVGQPPQWPGTVQTTAADDFFGSQKQELVGRLGAQWQSTHGTNWRKHHDEIRKRRERLVDLSALSSPTPDERFERGQLTELEGDENAALELYVSAHRQGHPAAGLAAGRILLDRHDASGMTLIDTAMDADADLIEEGCRAVVDFLESHGRPADAHSYHVRMTRQRATTEMARAERAELSIVDRLRRCTDPSVDVVALSRRLAFEPAVRRAFLATKELRHSRGTQTVLAVLTNNGVVVPDLAERLCREGVLPDSVTVVVLGRHDQPLEAMLRDISGTIIYDRSL